MSIETSGPQGYEYQYLVSLLITLRVIHNENIEVLIENQDGEDAQIKYIKNGKEEIIDIQVKKRSQPIEIDEYCKWISHFENRNFRSNLLTKLKKDKNRIAIFITNQRCKDEVSIFLSENEEIRQLSKPINSKKISSIKSYILSVYQKKIGIEKKRRLFLKDFLKDISNEELKNVLRRMIIFTQYKEENVEFEIKTILNSKFNITQNCLNNVILELLEVIKKGRDTKQNIVSDIYDRLEKSKGEKIFHYDKFYFKRDKVKKCIDILNEENVLLLTGISQCGKTYVAQDIAQKFQDSGYNIERTYDYNEAISFLKRSISDDRLCILDDPFGAIEVKDNGLLILKNIKELINNLRKDRKLIITTRKDILYKIKESKSLEECSILGVKWLDLTVVKKDEYKKIWSRYFKNNNKSNDLFNEVYNYLNKNENGGFLQPGQIKELFYNKTIDELSTLNISEVIEIARTDSKELAKKIKNKDEDYSKLMIALWLGCNTIESMKLNDLKYLLGESDEKPSLLEEKKNWNGISHSFNRDISIPKFPKYKYNYELNNVYKKGLQYLYDHGYISIENENITFNHPIYNNAGKFLFKKELNTLFNSENNIKLAYRSLGILDKTSVMNTIRILEEIYLEEKNNSIKRLILKGLYSIFPAVKDRVVSFFDSRINELSKEEQENFIDQLFFDENIEGSSILWYKEEPWFNTSNERKFHSYLMNNKLSDTEIIQIKQAVINNELISSKRMWDLLNETNFIFEIKEYEIILKKALKFKEAFIRGKAIYSLFKDYAYNYNKIDKYLDSNEHPNVIYNLFKGMLKSYEKYDNNKKLKIINFIKNNFDNMSVSIKFKKFLENFGDKYNQDIIEWDNYSDKQKVELWEVWYELIIELMIKFPSKHTSMNQPHLDSVMK
ncbi:hypothetical protein, partial [Halonatronum saccharophilum]|uniref:nSTAND3 domain-containing NTPase n=1 Tax=Halonatronum saccharophilum TaxID=150060 RepID=UPI00055574E3